MVEGTYQLPSRDMLGLLHSNIWRFKGVTLIDNGFSLARAHELYLEASIVLRTFGIVNIVPFILGMRHKLKFTLPTHMMKIGPLLLPKSLTNGGIFWRMTMTSPTLVNNLAFTLTEPPTQLVLQCSIEYTPSYLHQHQLSLPLPVEYFAVSTHTRCFSKCHNMFGDFTGFFHAMKIIFTT